MSEKVGPAASAKNAAEAALRARFERDLIKEDIRYLLTLPQFRRWATILIYASEFCGVDKTIWDPSARIHFFEGRRSVGIDVLKAFMEFPELYSQLEHERVEALMEMLTRLPRAKEPENDD